MGGRKDPDPLPPPPDPVDQAVRGAKAAERRRQLAGSGRQSTFLSGVLGDTSPVNTVPKTFLGQ